ncbi:MAG: hypothetical protein HWN65_09060 [Candidatus Helarchaeota archaeon]|nr:hypothetical protein [Candidatus Helarchaeota archaeon]
MVVERIVKCPICKESVQFNIREDVIEGKKYPVPCVFIHQKNDDNHAFIVYLDSELSLCDIETPEIVVSETK